MMGVRLAGGEEGKAELSSRCATGTPVWGRVLGVLTQ